MSPRTDGIPKNYCQGQPEVQVAIMAGNNTSFRQEMAGASRQSWACVDSKHYTLLLYRAGD